DDDDSTDAPVVPVGVTCVTPDTSFSFPFQAPGQVQLGAEVLYSDGSSTPSTDIEWALQDGFGGNISPDGLLTMPWNHGGQVVVEAWLDSLVGTCTLDLTMTVEEDLTGDPALMAALDLASADIDPTCAPELLYPRTGSVLPRNWAPLHIQWTPPPGANVFAVTIDNAWVNASFVTTDPSLQPAVEAWRGITDTWSGSKLELQVFAGTWDGTNFTSPLCATGVAELDLSSAGLEGQIFYWAAAASGVYRLTLGAAAPTLWADEGTTGWCVGCHTTNLDNPNRMAKVYGGGDGWVVVSDVDTGIGDVMAAQVRPGNFTALDPSGRWMVRSYQGFLYLDDLDAGIEMGTLPTQGHATHPNWSPDGLSLVYSSCAGNSTNDWTQENCSLRSLERVDVDQFANDTLLVAGGGGVSNYYASYSPDSNWIAFNRAYNEDTYDATSAELWLMDSNGGGAVELATANGAPGLANSWPRWGEMHDDVAWLAFASRRAYGAVTGGIPQVYLVGLDTDALGAGVDPSRPAIWLPGQDPAIGNHTPVWVPRFVAP
ncbi:MAG: PD40 domain-containing protein, partial [Deltaproteobacteria bacterium]|nr:PD40 domain-containing protein [Deltaproteobacteria bacterium]